MFEQPANVSLTLERDPAHAPPYFLSLARACPTFAVRTQVTRVPVLHIGLLQKNWVQGIQASASATALPNGGVQTRHWALFFRGALGGIAGNVHHGVSQLLSVATQVINSTSHVPTPILTRTRSLCVDTLYRKTWHVSRTRTVRECARKKKLLQLNRTNF